MATIYNPAKYDADGNFHERQSPVGGSALDTQVLDLSAAGATDEVYITPVRIGCKINAIKTTDAGGSTLAGQFVARTVAKDGTVTDTAIGSAIAAGADIDDLVGLNLPDSAEADIVFVMTALDAAVDALKVGTDVW